MKEIKIANRWVGPSHPPFIVAELSGNHQHSLEKTLQLVDAAKEAGAHAVKIQTYTPDTITLNVNSEEFRITEPSSLWNGRSLYDLYQEAHLPWEWHQAIFDRCSKLGLIAFSSPFDETAVDFLETLNVPCYKIASPEIVDIPLIKKVAALGKPVILSTGASTLLEIEEAVEAVKSVGCKDLIVLKCTASYPCQPKDLNLLTIPHMASALDVLVGLSDHSSGIGPAIASIALGACLIEKHFIISRYDETVDSAFSMEPNELKQLVQEAERAWLSKGEIHYGPLPVEKVSFSHRPSLYFVEDIQTGAVVKASHVRSVRPSKGLPPKEIDNVIGLTLRQSVKKGTPVSWNLFKE